RDPSSSSFGTGCRAALLGRRGAARSSLSSSASLGAERDGLAGGLSSAGAGMASTLPQPGHLAFLPANSSLALRFLPPPEHFTRMDIAHTADWAERDKAQAYPKKRPPSTRKEDRWGRIRQAKSAANPRVLRQSVLSSRLGRDRRRKCAPTIALARPA